MDTSVDTDEASEHDGAEDVLTILIPHGIICHHSCLVGEVEVEISFMDDVSACGRSCYDRCALSHYFINEIQDHSFVKWET